MSLIVDALKRAQMARLERAPRGKGSAPSLPLLSLQRQGRRIASQTTLLTAGATLGVGLLLFTVAYLAVARFSPPSKRPFVLAKAKGAKLSSMPQPVEEMQPLPAAITPAPLRERLETLTEGREGKSEAGSSPRPGLSVPRYKTGQVLAETAKGGRELLYPKTEDAEKGPRVDIAASPLEAVRQKFALGTLHQQEGNFAQARKNYEEVLRLSPMHVEAHNNLGVVYKELGLYREAVRELERALALNPHYAPAHHNLGVVRQQQGDLEGAARYYRRAIELDPHNARAYNNLGVVYRDLNRLAAAREALRKALSLDSSFPQSYYNLALVLEADGDKEGALLLYQQFVNMVEGLSGGGKQQQEMVERVRQHLLTLSSSEQQ